MRKAIAFIVLCQLVLAGVALSALNITAEKAESDGCALLAGKMICPLIVKLNEQKATLTDDIYCINTENSTKFEDLFCGVEFTLDSDILTEALYQSTDIQTEEGESFFQNYTIKADIYEAIVDNSAIEQSKCTLDTTGMLCSYNGTRITFNASFVPETKVSPNSFIITGMSTGTGPLASGIDANLIYVALGALIVIFAIAALRKRK